MSTENVELNKLSTKLLTKKLISEGKSRNEIIQIVIDELKVSRDHVSKIYKFFKPDEDGRAGRIGSLKRGQKATKPIKPIKKKTKRTLEVFKQTFDNSIIIPKKITEGIDKYLMVDGEPSYMSDTEFREACGLVVTKWRRYADEFKHLQCKIPGGGTVYWGHPDIIDEMRKAAVQ